MKEEGIPYGFVSGMMKGRWLPDMKRLKGLVEWIRENELSMIEVFRITRWCGEINKEVLLKLNEILKDFPKWNGNILRYVYYIWYFKMLSIEEIRYWINYLRENSIESYLIWEELKEIEDIYEILEKKFKIPRPIVWLRWKMKGYRKTSLNRLSRWESNYKLRSRYLSEEIIEEGSWRKLEDVLGEEDDLRELEMINDIKKLLGKYYEEDEVNNIIEVIKRILNGWEVDKEEMKLLQEIFSKHPEIMEYLRM